jgi:hypothetical protein
MHFCLLQPVHLLACFALCVWLTKLLEAAQSCEKLQLHTPMNLAQHAFAYGSPQFVCTRLNVRACCRFAHQ